MSTGPSLLLAVATLWAVGVGLVLHARTGGYGNLRWAFEASYAIAFAGLGVLVSHHHPGHPSGPLFALLGFGSAFAVAGTEYALYALVEEPAAPGAAWALWAASWSWQLLFPILAWVYFVLPSMRLPSPRWRPAFAYSLAMTTGLLLATALQPGSLTADERGPVLARLTNPLTGATGGGLLDIWYAAAYPLMATGMAVAGAASIMKYRRATGQDREQLRLLAFAVGIFPVIMVFGLAVPGPLGPIIAYGLSVLEVAVVTEAVLRRGWFGIRVAVNRSLVYGSLTALLLAVYAVVVVAVGGLVPGHNGASLAAAAVIAVAFAPLRATLQRSVDRLMYGDRRDPHAAVSRLGQRLETMLATEPVLPAVVATVAETLRVPYAAIDILDVDGDTLTAEWGERRASRVEEVALSYGGTSVGTLLLEARVGDRSLQDGDRALLAELAPHIAVAVHAVAVGTALQRSRRQLVTVLEEERRRLRRDLHDGLGPMLTAVTLQLDAVANLARDDPEQAVRMVSELRSQVKASLGEIRRLVYDLRPPFLDDLGLLGALREQAVRLAGTVAITIDAEELPPIPAAVEVAAYRIASEAMTNVVRHSGAQHCRVRVRCNGSLDVDVEDDGPNTAHDWRPGVGTRSIRERVSELGGSWDVGPSDAGGGAVRVRLPLPT